MALGLRQYVLRGAKPLLPHLPLVLFLVGMGLFISMPIHNRRNIYISENGLMPDVARDKFPLEQYRLQKYLKESEPFPLRERILARSGGVGETLLLLVSRRCPASVAIGRALVDTWRRSKWLALDIEVRFVTNLTTVATTDVLDARIIRGAFILDVCDPSGKICLDTVGSGGQLPNLDVVNTVVYSSTRRGFNFDVTCSFTAAQPLQEGMEQVLWRSLGLPHWKEIFFYWIHFKDMLNDEITAGPHAPLREGGVHTLTIRDELNSGSSTTTHPSLTRLLALGSVVEMWSRSLNNLNERIHHSFFLYYHMSPRSFVDNEVAQSQAFAFIGSVAVRIFTLLPQAGHGGILSGALICGMTTIGLFLSSALESFYVFPAFPLLGIMMLFLAVLLTHKAGRQGLYLSAVTVVSVVNVSVLCVLVMVHPALSVAGGLCLSLSTNAALTSTKKLTVVLVSMSLICSTALIGVLHGVVFDEDVWSPFPTHGIVRIFVWGALVPTVLLPVVQIVV